MSNHPGEPHVNANLHLNGLVPPTAHDLVSHEIHAVDFVRVSRQIDSDLECFEIPELVKTR